LDAVLAQLRIDPQVQVPLTESALVTRINPVDTFTLFFPVGALPCGQASRSVLHGLLDAVLAQLRIDPQVQVPLTESALVTRINPVDTFTLFFPVGALPCGQASRSILHGLLDAVLAQLRSDPGLLDAALEQLRSGPAPLGCNHMISGLSLAPPSFHQTDAAASWKN